MTDSTFLKHEARSRAGEQVTAWKNDVQFFFNNDWCRLRTLIMELEEESWKTRAAIQPVSEQGNPDSVNFVPPAASAISDLRQNGQATDSEQQPPVKDRLSELAAQIERRLQTANEARR